MIYGSLLLPILLSAAPVDAFIGTQSLPLKVTKHVNQQKQTRLPNQRFRDDSRVALNMMNMEELLYSSGAIANDLAKMSLEDPSNFFLSLPVMYGAGLLTSFSPCVWGLLPLTMSYISTASGEREDKKTLLPTLAFAAGLAAVFCTFGIIVASLGGVFGGTSGQNAILPILSNGICFAMGLQLLDLVQLPLPSFSVLDGATRNNEDGPILLDATGRIISKKEKQGNSLFRTFLLGGSSALVASPCATPVLTSILAYVSNAQSPIVGGILLLGYTLGYSTPLLIVASAGGQALIELRQLGQGEMNASFYGKIAPWITPLTGGVLLWYGTNGILTLLFGDPSLAALAPVIE